MTQLVRGGNFTNERDMFAFAVMIKGEARHVGADILPGTALLLDPGETLSVAGSDFIVAWPKRLDA